MYLFINRCFVTVFLVTQPAGTFVRQSIFRNFFIFQFPDRLQGRMDKAGIGTDFLIILWWICNERSLWMKGSSIVGLHCVISKSEDCPDEWLDRWLFFIMNMKGRRRGRILYEMGKGEDAAPFLCWGFVYCSKVWWMYVRNVLLLGLGFINTVSWVIMGRVKRKTNITKQPEKKRMTNQRRIVIWF